MISLIKLTELVDSNNSSNPDNPDNPDNLTPISNYIPDVQTYYNQVGNKYSLFRKYFWSEARKFIDWVKTIIIEPDFKSSPKLKFLDLGCGNGLYFQITTEFDSYGIDFSEKLISIARKRYPKVNLLVTDAINYNNPNNYSVILTVGLLQHLTDSDQLKLIINIINLLKKDGYAFISGMIDISMINEINGLITYSNETKFDPIHKLIQQYCLENIIELVNIKYVQHSVIFIIKKII